MTKRVNYKRIGKEKKKKKRKEKKRVSDAQKDQMGFYTVRVFFFFSHIILI